MKHLLIRLAKVLLKLAMDKALEQALPKIYKQIDAEVPKLLMNQAPPSVVQNAISTAIVKSTGGKLNNDMLDLVVLAYDPIKAAIIKR
jgi:hypothetical protein